MSVLDRWLDPGRPSRDSQSRKPATSATNRENEKSGNLINGSGVAAGLLQVATPATNEPLAPQFVADVAGCRSEVATRKPAENKASRDFVADVAGFRGCANPEGPETRPKNWRRLFEERAAEFVGRYTREEAERLAWGELENRWHAEGGERVPRDLCAGCRRPIGEAEALDLIDGNRVHFENNACLIRHGDRWRGVATQALATMGLKPPAGD